MKKTHKVVMLATEEGVSLYDSEGMGLFYNPVYPEYCLGQHLYIVSEEDIKEGDWYIPNPIGGGLARSGCDIKRGQFGTKKVIATTNESLTEYCKGVRRLGEGCNLNTSCIHPNCRPAKISQAFVRAYAKAGGIDEVELEYISYGTNEDQLDVPINYEEVEEIFGLKLRDDNTVILQVTQVTTF